MEVQQEHYSEELCRELLPLLVRNWRESVSYEEGLDVDPDFVKYRKLDELGTLICLTARSAGRLVGYVIFFIVSSFHHRTLLCGHGDAFYLEAGFRGYAPSLVRQGEAMLKRRGVKRLYWFAEPGSALQGLLRSMGYVDDEVLMEKLVF